MRTLAVSLVAALAIFSSACGATTRGTTTIQSPVYPVLSSAIATFVSRDHGKDKNSGLTVQLLRNNAELVGDSARLRAATGWAPAIGFERMLDDLLQYWREEAGRATHS